ncbi:hypothetical protein BH09ACT7_BH09ACT7_57590 [soil metagenome]
MAPLPRWILRLPRWFGIEFLSSVVADGAALQRKDEGTQGRVREDKSASHWSGAVGFHLLPTLWISHSRTRRLIEFTPGLRSTPELFQGFRMMRQGVTVGAVGDDPISELRTAGCYFDDQVKVQTAGGQRARFSPSRAAVAKGNLWGPPLNWTAFALTSVIVRPRRSRCTARLCSTRRSCSTVDSDIIMLLGSCCWAAASSS